MYYTHPLLNKKLLWGENMNESKQKRYGWFVAIIFFFAWGIVFLDRLTISFASNVVKQSLNLSTVQFSSLTAISTFCFSISAIVMGIVSDRTGLRKKILVPFLLIAGVLSFCCSFCQNYTSLLILRGCVGFFEGPSMTLMMAILASVSFGNTFGRNAGIVGAGVAVIANTIGPVLITRTIASFSWQAAFITSGVLLVFISIVVGLFVKEVKVEEETALQKEKVSYGRLFTNKNFLLCALIGICSMVGYWTTMIFAPMYLADIMNIDTVQRGLITSIMGAIFIVIQLFIPAMSDKFGRKPILVVSFIACVISPLGMWLAAGMFVSVILYCIFGGVPGSLTGIWSTVIPMETLPNDLKASAGGIILGLSELCGGTVWPLIAGGIADSLGGIPMIMMIAAMLLVVCVILSSLLKESNPKIVAAREANSAISTYNML